MPWSLRWFIYLVLLRPLIDQLYYLKTVSPFLSPLYIVGVTTPFLCLFGIPRIKKQNTIISDSFFSIFTIITLITSTILLLSWKQI